MPLIDLTPPPGVSKPGTVYDAKGRWYDTKWVRWFEGVMQAMGGFEAVEVAGTQVDATERVSGTWSWRDNLGFPVLAWGGVDLVKVFKNGAVTDVTPAGFTGGNPDAVITAGNYNDGAYGSGLYGIGDTLNTQIVEAQSYQMDNYGEDLVFVAFSDGKLYYMDIDGDGGDPAQAVEAGAGTGTTPVDNLGVVVTPENFLIVLGAGGDGRTIQWPDQDPLGNNSFDWAAVPTNQAQSLQLPGKGVIMGGRRAQAETLIWTTDDVFSLRYIGGDFVYQIVPVGAVGAVSRRSMGIVGSVAYWMGPRGFYLYNGFTQAIDSELADYVFRDINRNQISKVWCEVRSEYGEITWHYPSGGSLDCNRSVTYNYNDGFWFNNYVGRSAGEDRGALNEPVAFGETTRATQVLTFTGQPADTETVTIGSKTYTFQATLTDVDGNVHIGATTADSIANLYNALVLGSGAGTDYATSMSAHPTAIATDYSATTLTVEALEGGSVWNAQATTETVTNASWGAATLTGGIGGLLWRHETGDSFDGDTPEATTGPIEIGKGDNVMHVQSIIPDEKTLGDVDMYVIHSFYPTAAETTSGPFTSRNPTDARLVGRQIRFKVVQDQPGWRVGRVRADVEMGGER